VRGEKFKLFDTSWCVFKKFCDTVAIRLWWILKTVLTRYGLHNGEDDESNEDKDTNKGESLTLSLHSCSLCNLKIFPEDI
jgi:hypothetical protein